METLQIWQKHSPGLKDELIRFWLAVTIKIMRAIKPIFRLSSRINTLIMKDNATQTFLIL